MNQNPAAVDLHYMRRALELAERGWGRVHPNPLVGALVVRDGVVVGEGAHLEYGGPHAEVMALRMAGPSAAGATLYVTLEPCAHHGKTPPCTEAILTAGIARVVYATDDPTTAGGGGAILERAGLGVSGGIEAEATRLQNALFLRPPALGRPFVALKYGLSLDARIARAEGESTRITGDEAAAEVHRLRAGFDAIMVGGRTARTDDPLLTARGAVAPRIPPARVVVTGRADLPLGGRLVATAPDVPVWLVTGPDAPDDRLRELSDRGVRVLQVDGSGETLDPAAVAARLQQEGVRSIFCEGGGRLGAALLAARLVDRLYLFQAPVLFGCGGVPAFPGPGGFRGRVIGVRALGRDTLTIVERSD
jgi:diaminohydroxyphosphoribosylaminopyrimidine deaminase / 5-amino-6-(5-phosphoribosylamino)uracil reductase